MSIIYIYIIDIYVYGKHLYELDGSDLPLVSTTGPNLPPPSPTKFPLFTSFSIFMQ